MSKCNLCVRKLSKVCKSDSECESQCLAINYRFFKKATNADRIRNMSDEELARILFSMPHDKIEKTKTSNGHGIDLLDVVEWLKSEVSE